ncbi:hypothetical protein CRM22_000928 [Opisthorchis felineus]|uniref:Uncharacterized protein n=1 Tax=Opisthorchis felineus TaxID=147828 RepID=A0A4S2MH70_OPIFE|nr:hypothetical protein CRM22_000928 [Opisthorchis felineus]
MTLSVQKRFLFPPAIVIEIPHNSAGQSTYGSQEELQNNLSPSIRGQAGHWSTDTPGPFFHHPGFGSPKTQLTLRSDIHQDLLNTANASKESLSRRGSFRTSQNSVATPNLSPPYWMPCTHLETTENLFLGVPKGPCSLQHSQSLRSTKSFSDRVTPTNSGAEDSEDFKPFPKQFFRSAQNGSVLGGSRHSPRTLRDRCTNRTHCSIGNVVSPDAILQHVYCRSHSPHYSSSGASSSQISTHCLTNYAGKPIRLTHHRSFRGDYTPSPVRNHRLHRSSSLVEGPHVSRRLRSHECASPVYPLNRKSSVPRSHRSRKRHCSLHTEEWQQQRGPGGTEGFCLNSMNALTEASVAYNIVPSLAHRRHTDGIDPKPGLLKPLVFSRRANSVSSYLLRSPTGSFLISPAERNICSDCHQSLFFCTCGTSPNKLDPTLAPNTSFRFPGIDIEQGSPPSVGSPVCPPDSQETARGLCFCQLHVLLVIMQIVLGVSTTALGFYLHWKIPLLPLEECAFWAAIPLSFTGMIGSLFCFENRCQRFNRSYSVSMRRATGILSLISCVLCLVASIFSGQKGNVIATSGHPCQSIRLTTQTKNATQSSGLPEYEHQCCSDTSGLDGHNVCQCLNMRNQVIWSYHKITCRYLISSVKDYLILQSALMAVAAGVCLWFWVVLTEQRYVLGAIPAVHPSPDTKSKKQSISSPRTSCGETTTTSYDGRHSSFDGTEQTRKSTVNRLNCVLEHPSGNLISNGTCKRDSSRSGFSDNVSRSDSPSIHAEESVPLSFEEMHYKNSDQGQCLKDSGVVSSDNADMDPEFTKCTREHSSSDLNFIKPDLSGSDKNKSGP